MTREVHRTKRYTPAHMGPEQSYGPPFGVGGAGTIVALELPFG